MAVTQTATRIWKCTAAEVVTALPMQLVGIEYMAAAGASVLTITNAAGSQAFTINAAAASMNGVNFESPIPYDGITISAITAGSTAFLIFA